MRTAPAHGSGGGPSLSFTRRNGERNPRLPIHAAHGTELTAKSWQTEAPLRMLMNNLDPENAERPEDLVVYGGTGKAARNWEAYDALVRTLTTLEDDETMLVQSGKPVGVMRTHPWAPRVLIANSNLVGDWANWEEFRRLEDLGLTMYGQMTAGSWIYIGTQGILQGTFETFAAVADKRFDGTLAGTITVTAGLGGMGGAQPLAVTMNDGVVICIECDQARIQRRIDHRYLDVQADSLDEAVRDGGRRPRRAPAALDRRARQRRRRCCPSCSRWTRRSTSSPTRPRRTTRCSTCRSASPFEDWEARAHAPTRPASPSEAQASMAAHVRAMVEFQDAGAEVFDYGNSIRDEARKGGYDRAFEFPASCRRTSGRCSARARARSAGPRCPATRPTSPRPTGRSSSCSPTTSGCASGSPWPASGSHFQGLPGPHLLARVRRAAPGRPEVQRDGGVRRAARRPIVIGRDHLDCGSVASPYRETEAMLDGSDAIADWAMLNALVNTASGAIVGVLPPRRRRRHGPLASTPARSASPTAPTLAAQKIERVLTNDPGMGVIRHVDAGYDRAAEVAAERGVRVPMSEG